MGSSTGRQNVQVQSNTWSGAREMIKRIYGPGINDNDITNLEECDENGYGHYDRKPSNGPSVTGAVIGGTVGLVGSGLGWIGSSIKEGMDEADREEAEAKAEGGERLAKWEKDQANTEKWVGRFGRYGGAYVGIGILSALGVEVLVTPLALGMMGYISYKVVSKTINKLNGAFVKPNSPASVQSQYRKEAI
ncbi:hypothetical protein OAL32_01940 [Synechococcus sp. AH-551-G15]|nr:hypothetical protein [Synechococcus sp. AH-551-G15]